MAEGFILFSLHMTMVWDLANGDGIPGTDQCHCCLRKQTSISVDRRGWGIPDQPQGPRTSKQMSESRCFFA